MLNDYIRRVREEIMVDFRGLDKPLFYDGTGSTPAYNSGGRGVILPEGGSVLRVKGVDPFGHLTKKIADSKKNKINDVVVASWKLKEQISPDVTHVSHESGSIRLKVAGNIPYAHTRGNYLSKRGSTILSQRGFGPFGVVTEDGVNNSEIAYAKLARVESNYGLHNPCVFEEPIKTGLKWKGRDTYQIHFRLREMGEDLRLSEINELVVDNLSKLSNDEITSNLADILKFYARLNLWFGTSVRVLTEAKLRPTVPSFYPQNYVVAKHGNGFRLARVDHTSTVLDETLTPEGFVNMLGALDENLSGAWAVFNQVPVAALGAAGRIHYKGIKNPPSFSTAYKFSGLMNITNAEELINNLKIAFLQGAAGPYLEPIEWSRLERFTK